MILLIDSVDHYDNDQIQQKYTQVYDGRESGYPVVASGIGRRGTNCLKWDASRTFPVSAVLPFNGNTGFMGFAFRGVPGKDSPGGAGGWSNLLAPFHLGDTLNPTTGYQALLSTSNVLCSFRNTYYTQVGIVINQNGTLSAWRGDAAPTTAFNGFDQPIYHIATTADALQFNTWHFIEVMVTASDPGQVIIKVNGDVWMNVVADCVADNGGSQGLTEITFGQLQSLNQGHPAWLFDDIYVLDTASGVAANHYTSFLGDQKWTYKPVDEDGFFNEWIPSSGASRFAMVDEIPHDYDATFITTSGVGFRQSFRVATAAGVGNPVTAVQVVASARRFEGGPSSISLGLVVSGAEYNGTARGNTGSYSYHRQVFTKRPDTLAGLVDTDIEVIEPLVKKET